MKFAAPPILAWNWQRSSGLGADGVYDMLALRARVFILDDDIPHIQMWRVADRSPSKS